MHIQSGCWVNHLDGLIKQWPIHKHRHLLHYWSNVKTSVWQNVRWELICIYSYVWSEWVIEGRCRLICILMNLCTLRSKVVELSHIYTTTMSSKTEKFFLAFLERFTYTRQRYQNKLHLHRSGKMNKNTVVCMPRQWMAMLHCKECVCLHIHTLFEDKSAFNTLFFGMCACYSLCI